jgi:hypothetical protein
LPVLSYAMLHLRTYGPHATQYMPISRVIGFTLYNLG